VWPLGLADTIKDCAPGITRTNTVTNAGDQTIPGQGKNYS